MEEKVTIENINLIEVLKDSTVPERIKYILEGNPYSEGINHVAMIRGVVNDIDGGRMYPYPSSLIINGKCTSAYTASTFYVDEQFRKYMIGLAIPEKFVELSDNGITYGAGCSRDARPIYVKYLRYTYFALPRYIYLKKSRALLEMKINKRLVKQLSFICDLFFKIVHNFHNVLNGIRYREYRVRESLDERDYECVENIIKKDSHRFQEEHNAEWFKWILNFKSDNPKNMQKLFLIEKNNKPIAFWMMKVRFSKNIRQNINNVYIGTITEWGSIDSKRINDQDILALAIHYFPKYVDVIQTFTENKKNMSRWPIIKRQVGESNFFIKVLKSHEKDYIGYKDIKEWRLRPAMGDTMFD